jgi:ABC-type transporter Mla subunit MlaD
MRRTVFLSVGLLEFMIAFALIYLACQIPASEEIQRSFGKVERVTQRASGQIRLLQRQVGLLRRPGLKELARRLKAQAREFAGLIKTQTLDEDSIRALRNSLGEVGNGLDGVASALNPSGFKQIGAGLEETASFLDEKVIPAARRVADRLDASCKVLRADARNFGKIVRALPLDMKNIKAVHDSLGEFSGGLGKMNGMFRPRRVRAIQEGFRGMESSLSLGAGQVERLSNYTYPVLTFDGLRPEIDYRQFWPEGERIGGGMRKAAKGVRAAGKEMEDLFKQLPGFRKAIRASRDLVEKSQETLAVALKHRAQLEPLLKEMPDHAQRLADNLPRVGQDLAQVLRETENLKDMASALRKAKDGINKVARGLPDFRTVFRRSATVLRTMQRQLDRALLDRGDYQKAMHETVVLAEAFAMMLPFLTDQLLVQLAEEEKALGDLEHSIDDVGEMLPAYGELAGRFAEIGRFVAWIIAAGIAVHAMYLILSVRMGWRFSY